MRRAIVDGWIKLHRSILNNQTVMKNSNYLSIWIYLLLKASHNEYQTMFDGKIVTLKPGQLITGAPAIMGELHLENKMIVERALKDFEMLRQIDQRSGRRGRIITVLNWDKYQNHVPEMFPKSDSNVTQMFTTKKKEERSILFDSKESNCRSGDRPGGVADVIDAWNAIPWVPSVSQISAESKRGGMLKARIKQYGLDGVLKAVSQASKSEPYLSGQSWFTFDWFVKPNNFPKVLEGNFVDKSPNAALSHETEFNEMQVKWSIIKGAWGGDVPNATDGRIFWDICTNGAKMDAGADVDYERAMQIADFFLGAVTGQEKGDMGAWLIQESKAGLKKP